MIKYILIYKVSVYRYVYKKNVNSVLSCAANTLSLFYLKPLKNVLENVVK